MKIQDNNFVYSNTRTKLSFKGLKNASSLINSARMTDQFIKMAKIDTGSNEVKAENGQIPSTPCQIEFANKLATELRQMGLTEVEVDKHGILTATLQSNIKNSKNLPVIGLIAHIDTNEDVPTGPVNPKIHKNYQNGNILLENGVKITENELKIHKGEDIITSDGKTLLGSDDKSGIAEIIEILNVYKENPEIKHTKIRIAFTPDEETGMGADKFDIKKFGADVAYTIDGGKPEEIESETFNAYNPEIKITGKNVHPGYAHGIMINALKIAAKFITKLPEDEAPETTKGREGFFHAFDINGNEESTTIKMLVRDFDGKKAEERVKFVESLAKQLEKENPQSSITVKPNYKYGNMKQKLEELPEVITFAKEAIQNNGLIPEELPIRGGTDGSNLTLRGLLTPNLGAGMNNIHSKNEFVTIQDMSKCAANILNIVDVWTNKALSNEGGIVDKINQRRTLNIE
ncbi:MAG: peptidase T [bacterium]